MIGIMTVDPGGKTAIALGRFRRGHVKGGAGIGDTIREAVFEGRVSSLTITGAPPTQGYELATCWENFLKTCVRGLGIAPEDMYLAIEDWIPVPGVTMTKDAYDAVRVPWFFAGYRAGRARTYEDAGLGPTADTPITWQSAASAKSFATNDRLRSWDLWVPGNARDHERDARRHLAVRLRDAMR